MSLSQSPKGIFVDGVWGPYKVLFISIDGKDNSVYAIHRTLSSMDGG